MEKLYPLTFETIFKDKIWGGNKINSVLGKDYAPLPNCGETWEISGVRGNISRVKDGPLKGKDLKALIGEYKDALVGAKAYERFGDEFPLLVKFIDANDDLSIQVHPDDVLAKKRHNSFGKTEMWYVVQADEGATLISGFNQPVSKEKYLEYFNSGRLTDILNRERVFDEDVFFLPAGRVHTIGKGLLIAEIQQTSDITYRIYDFDRVDDKGNKRELHVEEALDAIDYQHYREYKTHYEKKTNEVAKLVTCNYFTTNKLHYSKSVTRDLSDIDCFKIYVCVDGALTMQYPDGKIDIKKGEAVLVPAAIPSITLNPKKEFKVLESYIG